MGFFDSKQQRVAYAQPDPEKIYRKVMNWLEKTNGLSSSNSMTTLVEEEEGEKNKKKNQNATTTKTKESSAQDLAEDFMLGFDADNDQERRHLGLLAAGGRQDGECEDLRRLSLMRGVEVWDMMVSAARNRRDSQQNPASLEGQDVLTHMGRLMALNNGDAGGETPEKIEALHEEKEADVQKVGPQSQKQQPNQQPNQQQNQQKKKKNKNKKKKKAQQQNQQNQQHTQQNQKQNPPQAQKQQEQQQQQQGKKRTAESQEVEGTNGPKKKRIRKPKNESHFFQKPLPPVAVAIANAETGITPNSSFNTNINTGTRNSTNGNGGAEGQDKAARQAAKKAEKKMHRALKRKQKRISTAELPRTPVSAPDLKDASVWYTSDNDGKGITAQPSQLERKDTGDVGGGHLKASHS